MTEKEKIQELEAQLAQRDVLLAQALTRISELEALVLKISTVNGQRILKSYSMTLSNSNKYNLFTIKMI